MSPKPTGRLVRTADGSDLIITRTFQAPAPDVWASITEPDRTARWYGTWKGDAAPGNTIQVQMAYEETAPWQDMRIEACEPPRRLYLSATDEQGAWRIELLLSDVDGGTEMRLVHHLDNEDMVGAVGPGWEYYMDMLVSARDGTPAPDFNDYYPSMEPHFLAQRQVK